MWLEIICQLVLLIFLFWKFFAKPANYPPGPWGLPAIGYIPLNGKSFTENLLDLRRKHANTGILSWRIGKKLVVFLFDNEVIKEALTSGDFDARPNMRALGFLAGSNAGLVSGNGTQWQNTRRFTLHHLRNLGMGKSSLIPVVQKEAIEFVKDLKAQAGAPAHLSKSVMVATLNVIWQMVASRRFAPEDESLNHFLGLLEKFRSQMDSATLVDFMPWLSSVMPSFLFKRLFKEHLIEEFVTELRLILQKEIDEHKEMLDENNPKDYIDDYLIELSKQENNPDSTFSVEDLTAAISDLFGAGSETTAVTLQWTFLYLAHHQEVQKRLQEEVDRVLPKGTSVTLEDKQRLPYTEAVYHEVLRHSCFVKLGFMHEATVDTQLGGYKIPQGTVVSPALFRANHDPTDWTNPEEFKPERFIDASGRFLQRREIFQPFGIGKRQCLGESLARMELLVFLTTVIQNIHFAIPPEKTIDLDPQQNTFVNYPKMEQELLMTVR